MTPGVLADRNELEGIVGRNPMPDFTGAYTFKGDWGYVRAAGVVRRIAWDDMHDDAVRLVRRRDGLGPELQLEPQVRRRSDVVRIQVVYGEGIQNYMNDSPVDVGIVSNPGNAVTPIKGELIPLLGTVFFLDHNVERQVHDSVGFSAPGQRQHGTPGAGCVQDAATTCSATCMLHAGAERDDGRRVPVGPPQNFSDGWTYDGYKIQFSFKYNFSYKLGG